MTKTILFVVNEARWFVTHRLPIGRAAAAAGYDVHVATPPGPFTQKVIEAGFTWHEVPLVRGSINPLSELRLLLSFVRLYRRVRPDLVHHVSAKPLLYGTIAARLTRVPAIVNAVTGLGHLFLANDLRHAVIRRIVGTLYRFVLRHKKLRIIFQNCDDRDLFTGKRWVRERDAVLIASGVDTETFAPRTTRNDGPPVVILPARLLYTKGVAEFVTAAERLKREGVKARFVLVGGNDPQNPASIAEEKLEEWRSSGVVELWGERHDMPNVYREADLVCLPSYREGMPKVLIEAASCGLAIVTTNAPGCRDVVREGENGLLVTVADADSTTAALRTLVTDHRLREEMGGRGRERVLREFSATRVASDTLAVYEELLA
ncbi:MAG TPA: glycosyltransferase family 4 protein [Thermoanaerobaculia bacterium]|jgi:glycosyltransferase involved in cell wall biosynthesis